MHVKVENSRHLHWTIGFPEIQEHGSANLENIFPYSRHFSANAQGAPGNYFRLLRQYGVVDVEAWGNAPLDSDRNWANSRSPE